MAPIARNVGREDLTRLWDKTGLATRVGEQPRSPTANTRTPGF